MWVFSLMMFLIIILIGVLSGITPLIGRQSTPFGVTFPPELLRDQRILTHKKNYALWNMSLSTVLAIPILFIPLLMTDEAAEIWASFYSVAVMIILMIVSFALYLSIRKDLLAWKKTLPLETFEQPKKVVVDLNYHDKLNTISQGSFFIWQLLIIGITVGIAFANYSAIPEQIPINWGPNMEANHYIPKQPLSVLALPIIQLLMIPVLQVSYYSFIRSRQKLSPLAPEISSQKSLLFRQAWARFFFAIAITTQLLISSLFLFSLFGAEENFGVMLVLVFAYLIFTIGASFYLSFKYGQAGEKLKLSADDIEDEQYYFDSEEDKQWIAGVFYYNPEDSAVFVEKRFGIGTTMNLARWQAWLIVGGLVLFMVATFIWSFWLGFN